MNPVLGIVSRLWVWGFYCFNILFLLLVLGLSGYFCVLPRSPLKMQIRSHVPSAQEPPQLPSRSEHHGRPSGSPDLLPSGRHSATLSPAPSLSFSLSGPQPHQRLPGPPTRQQGLAPGTSHLLVLLPRTVFATCPRPLRLRSHTAYPDLSTQMTPGPLEESAAISQTRRPRLSQVNPLAWSLPAVTLWLPISLSKSGPDFQLLCPTALPWQPSRL